MYINNIFLEMGPLDILTVSLCCINGIKYVMHIHFSKPSSTGLFTEIGKYLF